MSYNQKILSYLDSHRSEIISFMQKLIQTESVTGDESRIAALMAEECGKDGLEVELVEPARNRMNAVAKYKGTVGQPKVIMYSHYDTVPAGDLATWKYSPFSATIADGMMWGRGASDNKLATCGLTMAFRAVKSLGIQLKGDMLFTHVADEEKGGKFGFKYLMDKGYGEGFDYLFYAHSGSADSIGIAANGCMRYEIKVKGKSVHTSRLEGGINAVAKSAELILRLQKLANEVNLRQYHLPGTDTVMKSRFSINKCVGFVAHNNVPDRCDLLVDRRFTPAETAKQTEEEIKEVIDQLKKEDREFDAELSLHPTDWDELSVSPPDSEIVRSIQRAVEKLVGKKPKPIGGSHSSDHGWWSSKYHKPFASYGIGGSGGHMANEHVGVEDVVRTTKAYALLMLDLLGAV